MPFDFQWIFLGVIPLGQTGFLFKWTSIWKIHRLQIMFSMGKPLESMRFSLSRWTNEHIWSYICVCVCQDDEYGWTMIMPEWKVCMRFDSLKASFFCKKSWCRWGVLPLQHGWVRTKSAAASHLPIWWSGRPLGSNDGRCLRPVEMF